MPRSSICEGSVAPDTIVAPVSGSTVGQFIFKTAARPCVVNWEGVTTGQYAYININKDVDPSATSYDFRVGISGSGHNGDARELSIGGLLAVKTLRVFVAAGSVTNLIIRGWTLGGS